MLFPDRLVVLVLGAGRPVRRRSRLQVSAVRHEFRERQLRWRRSVRVQIRVPLDSRCRGTRGLHVRLLRYKVAAVPGRPPPRRTPARKTVAQQTGRVQVIYIAYRPNITRLLLYRVYAGCIKSANPRIIRQLLLLF